MNYVNGQDFARANGMPNAVLNLCYLNHSTTPRLDKTVPRLPYMATGHPNKRSSTPRVNAPIRNWYLTPQLCLQHVYFIII